MDVDLAASVVVSLRAEHERVAHDVVARALGCSRSTAYRKMRGLCPWTLDELAAVAAVVGLALEAVVYTAVDLDRRAAELPRWNETSRHNRRARMRGLLLEDIFRRT